MTVHALLAGPLAPTQPGSALVETPLAVRGVRRGVGAMGFDPAALAATDGLALQFAGRLTPQKTDGNRLALRGAYPVGDLALGASYAWMGIPGARHQRISLAAGLEVSDRLAVGTAMRALHSPDPALRGALSWDLGVLAEPFPWLSVSVGANRLNAPRVDGRRLAPAYRLGLGLRPLLGAPVLTLGADTRLFAPGAGTAGVADTRFLAEVMAWPGVHLRAAYHLQREQLWAGVGVALGSVEGRIAATPVGRGRSVLPWGQTGFSASVRQVPPRGVGPAAERRVEVVLAGALERPATGILSPRSQVPAVLWQLRELAHNDDVGSVLLRIGRLDVGLGVIAELRQAVAALQTAGKKVVAEFSSVEEKGYLVAAAADWIRMDPGGLLRLDGYATTLWHIADALANFGIRFETVTVGAFKTAPELYTRSEPSPARAQTQRAIVAQAYRDLVRTLVADRRLSPQQLSDALGTGLLTARDALAAELVDELLDPETGRPTNRRPPPVPAQSVRRSPRHWGQAPEVAVVSLEGTMVVKPGTLPLLPGGTSAAGQIMRALYRARRDDDVVGVVLRIDSPGGDVRAAEMVWREVQRLAEIKPVVACMGDVAASGGYYAAVPADVILAQPNTLTGSIGIFSLRANLKGLFDMLEVNAEVLESGQSPGWDGIGRPLSARARRRLRRVLNARHGTFVERVAAGRGMSVREARALADGRVFTGEQALRQGLIDGYGGLSAAVREVLTRAGLSEDSRFSVRLPQAPGAWSRLAERVASALAASKQQTPSQLVDALAAAERLPSLPRAQRWVRAMESRIWALMPMQWESIR